MDFLLAGTLVSSWMEFQCRVIVQRLSSSCGSPVENIPLEAEHDSGGGTKTVRLPTGTVFAFRPECCSESQRNGVRLQTGIAFAFDRIPHVCTPPKMPQSIS
jgi:hypothetical protein